MSHSYTELSDEDIIKTATDFLAAGVPVPEDIETRLRELGLYELICFPLSLDDLGV